jgi:hypothetical protein
MTAVLIDANVLLDVMTEDARWLTWSVQKNAFSSQAPGAR